MRLCWRGLLSLLALVLCLPASAQQHDHAVIGSSQRGGGVLQVFLDDVLQPVRMRNPFCVGGQCLYSTLDPALVSEPERELEGFHRLRDGTPLSLEIVAIDAAMSIKFGDRIYRGAGESFALGATPNLHAHPVWQLIVPEGRGDTFRLSFRVKTTSPFYAQSPVYELSFGNAMAVPTPTASRTPTPVGTNTPTSSPPPTPTATPTLVLIPTSTPEPIAGDVNCDEAVSAADLTALASLHTHPPCDTDLNGDSEVDLGDHVILVGLLFH